MLSKHKEADCVRRHKRVYVSAFGWRCLVWMERWVEWKAWGIDRSAIKPPEAWPKKKGDGG